ncbi:MAG: hypothetical protein AAF637_01305 [Pseudomonadota bacterium]
MLRSSTTTVPHALAWLICLIVVLVMSAPNAQASAVRDSAVGSFDLANARVLLYRSYLPTGGRDAVPLPDISVVVDGRKIPLPLCRRRTESTSADFRQVRRGFASGDTNLARILRDMARAAQVPLGGIRRDGIPFCAWWFVTDVDNFNIAFPDANATYWAMPFLVGLQDEVIIEGVYPDERYMSLALYNQFLDPYSYTTPTGEVFSSNLADYQIDPDRGSENPWQVEAEPGGSYTVTIKERPRRGETNVLPFLENPEQSIGLTGSFPMPAPCNSVDSTYACSLEGMFTSPPAAYQSSVFSNVNNTYLPAVIHFDTPDRVYVIRGKLPKTPPGTSPTPWPDSAYELRYWSLCNAVYVRPYPTITDDGCVADLDVVLDRDRYYTLVVSSADARPSNATKENGAVWIRGIEWVRNILVVRNMLPVDFPYAAQNVIKDGSWKSAFRVMQEYYPAITVACTTSFYEAHGWQGCIAPPRDGTFDPSMPGGVGTPGAASP